MIHYILFRTQAHATEDVSRVQEALETVLPEDTPIEFEETEGYFGNPIKILTARIEKKKAAEKYIEFLRTSLPEADLNELIKELPERVDDECNFYLRLSKQDAYLGDVRITYAEDAIAVRVKLAAYPAKYENGLKIIREYFHAEE
ncbi:exosome protein [Methanocella sp. CWC-04]|uniref:Exosome protein n=1 Tax=Methanooceanicella nereidis TaxID=2052831 RepID=A0AAP2RG36_9EURY|nr:RNA-binding domain-containing protein [Methanocella sp. CWC-04]MCD1296151.1 exosome protein [Methanocella sp. CWC-04]